LKISAKTAVFLFSSGKKTNFTTFVSPQEKRLENSLVPPSGKNASDAHAHKHVKLHHFCKKLRYTSQSGNTV